ncbi:SMI1/KNR4 family protein [Lentzea sp. NPDC042327]|uniref:SMI1/KNR4 family protein n=1 Tax=Lentzea sp. NPDC042327 TaxID=3154801 RepID=UPI0033E332DB
MEITDRTFPPALVALSGIEFPWSHDEEPAPTNIDYEPYDEFDPADETTDWIRAWTGNDELDGAAFRVFAQDGTGGLVTSWLVRPGRPLTEQPVAFFGSEGEVGVVATDLGSFLWLLAGGVGPQEAVEFGTDTGVPHPELRAVAEQHSGTAPRTPAEVLAAARAEFPDFAETVQSWCR